MPLTTSTSASPALLNSLRHGLSSASDAQLRQVVAMVDAMAERGPVDALLAPLRSRLAALQPARPLRFARLLFLPLDPLIVQPTQWRPGALTVPRSAIIPLADHVRAAIGDDAIAIDAMIAGRTTVDTDVIRQAARLLWHRAGEFLSHAPCPPGWSASGLPENTHAAIAQTAAIALRLALLIAALADGELPGNESQAAALEEILDAAQAAGPAAWRAIAVLLLLRLQRKQDVLRALSATTRQSNPAIRVATEQAIEAVLDILEQRGRGGGATVGETIAGLDGVINLLNGIVADGAGPARGQRVQSLRIRLDATCQAALQQGLAEHVLAPLDTLLAAGSAETPALDDAAITIQLTAMEDAARSLRTLEIAGQRLGKPESYASLLRDAADQVQAQAPNAALTPMDRARLVELLVSTDAALESLAQARRQHAA